MLTERLASESDASVRQAILLAMGDYPQNPTLRDPLAESLLKRYGDDPDPGVHSATGWLLNRWGLAEQRQKKDEEQATSEPVADRRWSMNSQGHTMVVVPGPVEFLMGSPVQEPNRNPPTEHLHGRRIPRSFAISTQETTVEQFLRFKKDFAYIQESNPDRQGPISNVTWYDAVAYCRWLSEQERISEDQMCFPPLDQIGPAMTLPPNVLQRTGYRLPTEAEWEYACRAGSTTQYCFGNDPLLLSEYVWHEGNSQKRTWPVGMLKPNYLGLFDVHGNVGEWCWDYSMPPLRRPKGYPTEDEPWPETDGSRTIKGGAIGSSADGLRSARQDSYLGTTAPGNVGFRVARTLPR